LTHRVSGTSGGTNPFFNGALSQPTESIAKNPKAPSVPVFKYLSAQPRVYERRKCEENGKIVIVTWP
jgi:hypothetical protein